MRSSGWVLAGYLAAAAGVLLAARLAAPPPAVDLWAGTSRFDAAGAHRQAGRLAEGFPYRPTGSSGAAAAARWLEAEFRALGLQVGTQRGEALLGGRRVTLVNVYAVSPGRRRETVAVVANFDMAPTSYQAASDTAAGVGVLLELARVLAREPHERTLVFVAPDGEEWGMLGARLFAFDPPVPGPLVASVVVEDLAIGGLVRLIPTMTGQFRGYTPMWLREVARRATQAEGIEFADPPSVLEYADRAVLISATDQGPLLAAGIPSIELTTEGDHPVLQDEIYHAPGDRMELMRVDAFAAFGRIAERMVRTLDPITIPREEAGVRLSDGRYASGWPLRLAQVGLFLPLLIATLATTRRDPWLRGFVETLRRFAILLAMYGAVRALPALGLLPGYELYPPPPK
ncbi:MAG: M28 family metallopeptidase, partial [Anaerolineales bacterium]